MSQSGIAVDRRRRALPVALLSAMRPRQWSKNLLLFSGLVFARVFGDPHAVALALGGFGAFCALCSGVYLLNDVRDRERDAAHEVKRRRPIPSGELPVGVATMVGVVLLAVGLGAAFWLDASFALVAVGYLALQGLYNLGLKDVVVLDVFLIATGFVLRALAGALVLHVRFSPWLFLCTMMLALFLGFGKRRHELITLGVRTGDHRPSLAAYTAPLLDQAVGLTATGAVLSYALYTITSTTGQENPYLMFTIPFVLYGVLRYLYHLYSAREGGSPDRLLFADIHTGLTVLLWMTAVILAMIMGEGSPQHVR